MAAQTGQSKTPEQPTIFIAYILPTPILVMQPDKTVPYSPPSTPVVPGVYNPATPTSNYIVYSSAVSTPAMQLGTMVRFSKLPTPAAISGLNRIVIQVKT